MDPHAAEIRAPRADDAPEPKLIQTAAVDPPPSRTAGPETPRKRPNLSPEKLLGTWRLGKNGERKITIHPDGTATADVRLDTLGAFLYAPRISLDLDWTLRGDVMTHTVTSGRPERAVSRLVSDWGSRREYQILAFTSNKLKLAEIGDEGNRKFWIAVRDQNPSPTSSPSPAASKAVASENKQSLR